MQINIEDISAKHLLILSLQNHFFAGNGFVLLSAQDNVTDNFLQAILSLNGIKKILLTAQTLAAFYDDTTNKDELRLLLMAETDDYFAQSEPMTISPFYGNLHEAAETLADVFIRPTLNRDNGDLDILRIEDNTVFVRLTGHCAGCPFAQNTLNNVIAKTFQKYIPQIEKVEVEEK